MNKNLNNLSVKSRDNLESDQLAEPFLIENLYNSEDPSS